MLNVAITGANGMLGSTLMSHLSGVNLIPLTKNDLDITRTNQVVSVLQEIKPDVVIHCAAMTKVDLCETKQFEAWRINAFGTTNIASACNQMDTKLIAISTDYVFDGYLDRPYHEYDFANGGLNIYAKSKWAAEQAVRNHCPNHLIARVSWLYGQEGPSFVHAMLKLADGSHPVLKVVSDQVGNPTSTVAVSDALQKLLENPELVGTIHLTCEGEASWYDFAKKIFEIKKIKQEVIPCTSEVYPTPAKRPKNSRLEKLVLKESGIHKMPHWETALEEFLSQESRKLHV